MDKVISVKPLENYLLEIEFADGLRKVIDIQPFIGKGISAALKDVSYFRHVKLEDGGGITCYPNSNPTILKNYICYNSANWSGGGIRCRSNSHLRSAVSPWLG